MSNHLFITFEGIDGGGKSTQIDRLRSHLEASRMNVVCTREPGGTEIGDVVRELLLSTRSRSMGEQAEVLLYAASRAQLLHEVIRPALAAGKVVLCDRYVDASIAYQGAGLGVGVDTVRQVNDFATGGLQPDLTFLFDLPVEASKERVSRMRPMQQPDRIEARGDTYFEAVRRAFLAIAEAEPTRVVVLNALLPPDRIEQEIGRRVANLLNSKGW